MSWARVLAAVALTLGSGPALADARVMAAASLTDSLAAIGAAFTAETGVPVSLVTDASSTLARQIVAGAPAGVFISANREWVDEVVRQAGWRPPWRFAGNSLVVIGRAGAPRHIDLGLLPDALGEGRLALGDPAHVPAGIYAKQALEAAGVWDELADRIAPADNVRAAVALVAGGAAPFGIVYATDGRFAGVTAVLRIGEALHDPIVYWMSVASGASTDDTAFAAFAGGETARGILAAQGFVP